MPSFTTERLYKLYQGCIALYYNILTNPFLTATESTKNEGEKEFFFVLEINNFWLLFGRLLMDFINSISLFLLKVYNLRCD